MTDKFEPKSSFLFHLILLIAIAYFSGTISITFYHIEWELNITISCLVWRCLPHSRIACLIAWTAMILFTSECAITMSSFSVTIPWIMLKCSISSQCSSCMGLQHDRKNHFWSFIWYYRCSWTTSWYWSSCRSWGWICLKGRWQLSRIEVVYLFRLKK